MASTEAAARHLEDEQRMKERLRIRAKYAQRAQERKIEMYYKALEIVQQQEAAAQNTSISVRFQINFATHFGQELFLVGSLPAVGNWDPNGAVRLEWSEGNNWWCNLKFPSDTKTITYKYIVRNGSETNWEWGRNHVIDLQAAPRSQRKHSVIDVWGAGTAA